jgi:ParB-like chromosome segregation protein Spo0J
MFPTVGKSINKFALDMAKKIGLKKSEIYNYFSLLNLVSEVQEMVSEAKLGVKFL